VIVRQQADAPAKSACERHWRESQQFPLGTFADEEEEEGWTNLGGGWHGGMQ